MTGAPILISRINLIALVAIISVVAYFAGSGAFKPYSTEVFAFFSQRTALAPASLPKEEASATETKSDHDQLAAPNDLSRSLERPVAETQTRTPVAAAELIAAPQTAASLPKEEASATETKSDHDQLAAPNDLSRSLERPVAETQTRTPVAAAELIAAPQTAASLPKEEASVTETKSDHDQLAAPNDLSRSLERPVAETQTRTPVAAAELIAAPQTAASLPKEEASATETKSDHDQLAAPNDLSRSLERPVAETQTRTPVAAAESIAAPQTAASLPKRKRRRGRRQASFTTDFLQRRLPRRPVRMFPIASPRTREMQPRLWILSRPAETRFPKRLRRRSQMPRQRTRRL